MQVSNCPFPSLEGGPSDQKPPTYHPRKLTITSQLKISAPKKNTYSNSATQQS